MDEPIQILDLGYDSPLTLWNIELLCEMLRKHGRVEVRCRQSVPGTTRGPWLSDIFPLIITEREKK
jgi:hypothetical protein